MTGCSVTLLKPSFLLCYSSYNSSEHPWRRWQVSWDSWRWEWTRPFPESQGEAGGQAPREDVPGTCGSPSFSPTTLGNLDLPRLCLARGPVTNECQGVSGGCSLVAELCPILCNPVDCSPPASFCPWDFPGKNTGLPFPSPSELPDPEIKPLSHALTGRFFTTEPPGKPPGVRAFNLIQILKT